jgi:hypothetical protein
MSMARRKNRKVTKETTAIDMSKYNNSDVCVEECSGCKKMFTHTFVPKATLEDQPALPVVTSKCLAYVNPEAKWGTADVVMKEVTTKVQGVSTSEMLPVIDTSCPLATHVGHHSATSAQEKVRVGQQKQKSKT